MCVRYALIPPPRIDGWRHGHVADAGVLGLLFVAMLFRLQPQIAKCALSFQAHLRRMSGFRVGRFEEGQVCGDQMLDHKQKKPGSVCTRRA